jgi:hypothetical protein
VSSQELSPIVVEMLVALADRADVSVEELCQGLPADERTLRAQGGLDWDVATQFIERLEARIGPEKLRALATRVPDISSMGRRILGRFIGPATMLRFVFGAIGPTMYPMYVTRYDEQPRPDGAIEFHVSLRLKDGFRDCRTMFDLNGISTAALPAMIGQPPLPFRAETTGRGGDYWFIAR